MTAKTTKTPINRPAKTPTAQLINTPKTIKLWPSIQNLHPEANFLQSPEWGRMNALIGHKIIIEATDDAWCLMIVKNAKRGRYLEIPGGPLLDWQNPEIVQSMFAKIRTIAKREKCVFVRLRPQLRNTPENLQLLASLGLKKAPMHLHAEHTVILDLEKSEDELLKDMRRQTRYEVRRAGKLGITVDWSDSEDVFREFHQVQSETALRQHFVPPDLKTLLAERTAFNSKDEASIAFNSANEASKTAPTEAPASPRSNAGNPAARLYIAKTAEGVPIAYGLILIDGAEAEYFEAASTELNHKLPGAYALQWQVIKDLKKLGIKRYNLWGIAPHGQKNHRYAGVTTFKTGFGGEIVEFTPASDLVIRRIRYLFNLLVETIRKKRRHL